MKTIKTFSVICFLPLFFGVRVLAQPIPIRVFPSAVHQSEPHIAINPTDPKNIIVAAITLNPNRIGAYYTLDGGAGWQGSNNISLTAADAGDPVIAFDGAGVAYCLYQIRDNASLYLRKSLDGGATWSDPPAIYVSDCINVDRPWMIIDQNPNVSGIYEIFITVTEFPTGANSKITLIRSNDGGNSLSSIKNFTSATNYLQGSSVTFGLSSDLYVAYAKLTSNFDPAVIGVEIHRTTNRSVSSPTFALSHSFTVNQIGQRLSDGGAFNYFVKAGQIRVDSYPRLATDLSLHPSTNGRVYVVWADQDSAETNIWLTSRNPANGQWSATQLTSSFDQWAPAIHIGPDGVRHVLFYSTTSAQDEIQVRLASYHPENNSPLVNKAVGIIPLFKINTSYNYFSAQKIFLGDYFGATGWRGKAYCAWIEGRGQVSEHQETQAYFKEEPYTYTPPLPANYVLTKVSQVDASDINFGKFGRWRVNKFVDYAAPYDFLWPYPSSEVLRTFQGFKPNTTQKYNKWNLDNDVLNHRVFTIDGFTLERKGQFQLANNATLRTEVIDGGGLNIEFQDPWLIDYPDPLYGNQSRNRGQTNAVWYLKVSPFSPNTTDPSYKGVFLNQTVATGNYYSVRPTNQTVNGLSWFLMNWITTGATVTQPTSSETPVVFTASNADVKARVKLRLGSSLSSATAANGQRKLAFADDTPDKFHLVYESAGEIYYIVSTDNGATWSNEILLSTVAGNNKYPSLASYQNKIYVIWQRTTSTNNYTVYARRYTSGSWAAPQTLGSASLTTGNNPLPVITMKEVLVGGLTKIRLISVWKGASALRFRTSEDDGATWATEASVSGTSSSNKNPSLSAGLFFGADYQDAYLTYDEGSLIRMKAYSTSWGTTETPPGATSNSANSSQVIVQDTENLNGHAHVVWQGTDPGTSTAAVYYQRKSGIDGSWSAVQSYVSNGYQRPVITHMSSNNLAMLWDKSGSVYKATYTYSTNSWSTAQNMGAGQYPSASAAFGSDQPAGKYASMINSSAPYKIQIASETLQKSTEENGAYSRRVAVTDAAGAMFIIDVHDVYFRTKNGDTKPLNFVAVDDTLLTLPLEEYWSYLETQPLGITSEEDSLIAEVNVYSQNPKSLLTTGRNALSLNFEMVDRDSAKTISNLGNALSFDKSGNAAFRLSGKISSLAGKNISLRPTLQGIAKNRHDLYYSLIHVHYDDKLNKQTLPGSPNAVKAGQITTYQLHQNYPNPFNPTTTLRFDLPEAGYVSLKVFDLLGNEVMTLVEEDKTAGAHRVELDGAKLQSGVYLSRLQAGVFSQTIKVTLLK